jgi:hypothetical protein
MPIWSDIKDGVQQGLHWLYEQLPEVQYYRQHPEEAAEVARGLDDMLYGGQLGLAAVTGADMAAGVNAIRNAYGIGTALGDTAYALGTRAAMPGTVAAIERATSGGPAGRAFLPEVMGVKGEPRPLPQAPAQRELRLPNIGTGRLSADEFASVRAQQAHNLKESYEEASRAYEAPRGGVFYDNHYYPYDDAFALPLPGLPARHTPHYYDVPGRAIQQIERQVEQMGGNPRGLYLDSIPLFPQLR